MLKIMTNLFSKLTFYPHIIELGLNLTIFDMTKVHAYDFR